MRAPENRGRIVVGMFSAALPVLLLWRCAAKPEPPPAAATVAASALPPTSPLDAAPVTPPPSAPPVDVRAASDASAPAPSSEAAPAPASSLAPPAPAATSTTAVGIVAAVASRDPRDLALLSRIERELKRDPPPAVHALIRMREAGASRAQLLAEAEKQLGGDVALRVLVRRWIDEAASGAAAPPKALGPTQGGGKDPMIKPIEPAKTP